MKLEIYRHSLNFWKKTLQYGWTFKDGQGNIMAGNKGFINKPRAIANIKKVYKYFKYDFRVVDLLDL